MALLKAAGSHHSAPPLRTANQMWSDLAADAWHRGQVAGDPHEARRWLERARRIAPDNDTVGLSLALACLNGGDAGAAQALFGPIAAKWNLLEAWVGLAAAALRAGDTTAAVAAMQAALSRHAVAPGTHALANAVARAAGMVGWCAVDTAGRLHVDRPADLWHGGKRMPVRWTENQCRIPDTGLLMVRRGDAGLLGSPVDRDAMRSVEGFVAATPDGGLAGWAWHPCNPTRAPALTLSFADGTNRTVIAQALLEQGSSDQPLALRRAFAVEAAGIPPGPVSITAGHAPTPGRAIWGSPIDPGMERRSAAGLERSFMPVWASIQGPAVATIPDRPPVDVVIPVYRGVDMTLACIDSVLPTLLPGSRLHVVDDGAVDAALGAALDGLAAAGRITLHRLAVNQGFPTAANTGLRAAAGRDAVLLNSDTIVPPGWLLHLANAAHSAPDIGSACPLSNDATILSYPRRDGGNPVTDPGPVAALALRANGAATVDIPVAVGFCMYMRRDCIEAVGLLREDIWAQGYGEENDWCLRARHRGWRHVAAPGCFVAHVGGASFGAGRQHLMGRNGEMLERLHPGYGAMVTEWIGQDPLGPARRRMDALRWRAGRRASAVVLVTHAGGGGVDRVVAERAEALRRAGVRPIVLRPAAPGLVVVGDGGTPNLRYRLPDEWPALLRLLRADRVRKAELHHTLGHGPAILDLPARLGVPYDVIVHDYALFCARIALVPEHTYCGEPPIGACEACVSDHGSELEEPIQPAALVARSAALLAAAQAVVAPAADVATRIQRHFPSVRPVVTAWEDDAAVAPPPATRRPVRHVCVIGGIGVEKGYEVLLACVRDAVARALPLRFTVVGYTADDERMLAAGPVFITGEYATDNAVALIRAQAAEIAFLPSIWPETWCFTLGQAWRAGLRAAVFNLGAPAERVRRTGWGDVLPLGLPAPALNDWFLRPDTGKLRSALHQTPSPSPRIPAI